MPPLFHCRLSLTAARRVLLHIGSGSPPSSFSLQLSSPAIGRYIAANHAPLTEWAESSRPRSIRIHRGAHTDHGRTVVPGARWRMYVRWKWRLIGAATRRVSVWLRTLHQRLVRWNHESVVRFVGRSAQRYTTTIIASTSPLSPTYFCSLSVTGMIAFCRRWHQ